MIMTDKKVLTLQDISCYGQCSITVALPIISACGVETAIIPSAVLSTHTGGFSGFTFRDLTDDIPGILSHWQKEGIKFDCIYTGYLGNISQVKYVSLIKDSLLNEGALVIVDPAMADDGKLYQGFDEAFVKGMRELCKNADILLPNLTEASMMADVKYMEGVQTKEYVDRLLLALGEMGAKKIILKGISFEKDKIGVAVYDSKTGEKDFYFTEKMSKNSPGTGDCFASSFTGAIMRGKSTYEAARIAADFVVECIKNTIDDDNHAYGVKFEKAIPTLVKNFL